ncbi:MAG: GNAT family N-acetyltransferase [Phycisphaerales bacterium]|nr:GNAT family N-acetyltransferase [Phycisphaerales bacterium]
MENSNLIVYSAATLDDLPAVVRLCMLVEEQHENYWRLRWERRPGLSEGYLRWLTHRIGDPRMFIHVAKDPTFSTLPAPSIVGMIVASINDEIPIYTYSEYALVQDMAVIASHRRRGIGQQLLKNAAAWARGHNLTQLRLLVADKNPDAQAAFLKTGFVPTYHEMVLPLKEEGDTP